MVAGKKIFSDIEEHENAFARYYPMMRIKITHNDLIYLVMAFVLNDAFYEYCQELSEIYKNEE